MLPKAHLTLYSGLSDSRWIITPLWLPGSWRSFLYSSSVYSCHLFLIYSAYIRFILLLFVIVPICMKCSLGISNFLEEISKLSHSIIPLFLCIDCWGRLSYLSLLFFGTLHLNRYIFPFSFAFHFSSFLSYLYGLLRQPLCLFHFFSLGMVLITASCTMSQTSIHSSSGTLAIRSNP